VRYRARSDLGKGTVFPERVRAAVPAVTAAHNHAGAMLRRDKPGLAWQVVRVITAPADIRR